MPNAATLHEPARETPVAYDCDLLIVGGSCTGVFAAVRAARMGLSVALIEQNILLGGMAAAAQVNEWHALHDISLSRPIIGGMTPEVLDRLRRRNAVLDLCREDRGPYFLFNSAELAVELDSLIREHRVRLFLKCLCVGSMREGDRLSAAIIEDKTGRRAITARQFIDASGDGDLLRRSGFAAWKHETLQPVSYQMVAAGLVALREKIGRNPWERLRDFAEQYGYPIHNSTPWINRVAAPVTELNNVYGPRLNGIDATDADQYTQAVLDSRRHLNTLLEMARKELGGEVAPIAWAHSLGVRETWHARCRHQLTVDEVLAGHTPADSVARGTYPVDVHSPNGTVLRHLDGREDRIGTDGSHTTVRWRPEGDVVPCYHIPYRCLVPEAGDNLLVAGRLLDADREAFGGVRVMVNMNQTGEAAATAAVLALRQQKPVHAVDPAELRHEMADQGSLMD